MKKWIGTTAGILIVLMAVLFSAATTATAGDKKKPADMVITTTEASARLCARTDLENINAYDCVGLTARTQTTFTRSPGTGIPTSAPLYVSGSYIHYDLTDWTKYKVVQFYGYDYDDVLGPIQDGRLVVEVNLNNLDSVYAYEVNTSTGAATPVGLSALPGTTVRIAWDSLGNPTSNVSTGKIGEAGKRPSHKVEEMLSAWGEPATDAEVLGIVPEASFDEYYRLTEGRVEMYYPVTASGYAVCPPYTGGYVYLYLPCNGLGGAVPAAIQTATVAVETDEFSAWSNEAIRRESGVSGPLTPPTH